jgi:hypothetical protein
MAAAALSTTEAALDAHYTEHLPPDVTAGMLWLKNRRTMTCACRSR